MGRCTRTEEVHCLRIGCSTPTNKNKRGTGTPNHSPPHPSMRSWALLVARRPRRPRRHLHSGPLRPTPTPPTPLHAKSPLTCAQVCPERHLTGRRRDLWERTRPPSRNTWKCPHQRVLSNSPRLPNVADSGSRVPNPLHKEAGGVHSYAAGMLFLRVRGCGVDAPPFVFSVQ